MLLRLHDTDTVTGKEEVWVPMFDIVEVRRGYNSTHDYYHAKDLVNATVSLKCSNGSYPMFVTETPEEIQSKIESFSHWIA